MSRYLPIETPAQSAAWDRWNDALGELCEHRLDCRSGCTPRVYCDEARGLLDDEQAAHRQYRRACDPQEVAA